MTLLLDSVVLIDHFNGHADATAYLRAHRTEAAVSAVTYAEVLTGFEGEAVGPARAVLDAFAFVPVGLREARTAAVLRRRERWKLPDALQAAVAQTHGLQLVSRNTRDFDPERHPFVVVPYAL